MKTIDEMIAEVLKLCQEKGWYDRPISFDESMALIHSEISEALDAYRRWDVQDATDESNGVIQVRSLVDWHVPGCLNPHEVGSKCSIAKPEGIGAELADIFIRMLDDCSRYGITLEEIDSHMPVVDSFGGNINTLHRLVSRASEHHSMSDDVESEFGAIYSFLLALCKHYGVNLEWEYERKMAFNWTRPYRHGRKHY